MLSSISPVGEASRGQRWPVTATAYLVGSAIGGATSGAVLGLLGAVPTAVLGRLPVPAALAAALAAALVAWAVDAGRLPLRPPSWERQVDERWLDRYRGWVYGLGFGWQLGGGWATRLPSATVHLSGVLALLASATTGAWTAGLAVGTAFGLVRGLPMLLAGRLTDPASLQRFHRRMDELGPTADAVTRAGALGAAVVAAAALVTTLATAG